MRGFFIAKNVIAIPYLLAKNVTFTICASKTAQNFTQIKLRIMDYLQNRKTTFTKKHIIVYKKRGRTPYGAVPLNFPI